jgi:hypothetical protein
MQRLYEIFEDEYFEILAVSIDASLGMMDDSGYEGGNLAAFAREYGLTVPILHDPSGGIQQTYRTRGVPESCVVAKGGLLYRTERSAWARSGDLPVNQELIRRLLDG